jgi:hypothetical protein
LTFHGASNRKIFLIIPAGMVSGMEVRICSRLRPGTAGAMLGAGGIAPMGELAAAIVEAANRPHHDRDDVLDLAKEIVAKTDSRTAAELCWAVLSVIAREQAQRSPWHRVTWRPSQARRRG